MNPLDLCLEWADRLAPLTLGLLNRAIGALWLLGAILVLRLILRRCSGQVLCFLWILLALRLALPVQITSPLSLLWNTGASVSETGEREYVRQLADDRAPDLEIHAPAVRTARIGALRVTSDSRDYRLSPLVFLAVLWPIGCLGLLLYALISALRLRRRLREAIRLEDGVWLSDRIDGPFLFGLLHPRVYLPADLAEDLREPVLRHERAHLARLDHWWKLLGWLLLCAFWFDPFLWLAYFLFCRDLELACDERVIRSLPAEERKGYASALLECSLPRGKRLLAPLAFGEAGIRARIRAVLRYRKPAFLLILLAAILILAAALFFGTDPVWHPAATPAAWQEVTLSRYLEEAVHQAILDYQTPRFARGDFPTESHVLLAADVGNTEATVWIHGAFLVLDWDGQRLTEAAGCMAPARLTFRRNGRVYTLTDYWEPLGGEGYYDELRANLPAEMTPEQEEEIARRWKTILMQRCYDQAVTHYAIDADALTERLFRDLEATGGEDAEACFHHAPQARHQLQYLGQHTCSWVVARFLEGEHTGLRGELLWRILQDLDPDSAGRISIGSSNTTPRACFDVWLGEARKTEKLKGLGWMETNRPWGALALELAGGYVPTDSLELLTCLQKSKVEKAECRIYGGTGAGIVFTLDRTGYSPEIDALMGMFSQNAEDYVRVLYQPSMDFSVGFFDADGGELATVFVSGGEVIRIGNRLYRCKQPMDTQAFNNARAAARNDGLLQYPQD